jgi:hypothetical protein
VTKSILVSNSNQFPSQSRDLKSNFSADQTLQPSLMELSIDILREILKRVSLDDFGQLRRVSKQFNELCSREIKCRVSRRLESGAAFMTLNTQLPQDQYTELLEEVANSFKEGSAQFRRLCFHFRPKGTGDGKYSEFHSQQENSCLVRNGSIEWALFVIPNVDGSQNTETNVYYCCLLQLSLRKDQPEAFDIISKIERLAKGNGNVLWEQSLEGSMAVKRGYDDTRAFVERFGLLVPNWREILSSIALSLMPFMPIKKIVSPYDGLVLTDLLEFELEISREEKDEENSVIRGITLKRN